MKNKFTDTTGNIIHITDGKVYDGMMSVEGTWSTMTDEEYELFIEEQMEYARNNPPPPVEEVPLTAQEKLEKSGLTVDELKGLLGL